MVREGPGGLPTADPKGSDGSEGLGALRVVRRA